MNEKSMAEASQTLLAGPYGAARLISLPRLL